MFPVAAVPLHANPLLAPTCPQEFLDLAHARGISSFMVTNAQFPEHMEKLKPCTQLYISVDAPTKEELKAVDRPLFTDFWERFLACAHLQPRSPRRKVGRIPLI